MKNLPRGRWRLKAACTCRIKEGGEEDEDEVFEVEVKEGR